MIDEDKRDWRKTDHRAMQKKEFRKWKRARLRVRLRKVAAFLFDLCAFFLAIWTIVLFLRVIEILIVLYLLKGK